MSATQYKGKGGGSHAYSQEETESAKNFLNHRLSKDADLKDLLPIDEADDLFKLINIAVPDTIDERTMNKPKNKKLNTYQIIENHNLAINSAKAIGCSISNIGPDDLISGTPHLVLGVVWQVIKIGLMKRINLKEHPELIRLLEEGESLEDFLALPPEQILLRWFNYQLKQAKSDRRVKNFGNDIKDSEAYTILLKQVSNGKCSMDPMKVSDKTERAEKMLGEADRIGVREFVSPRDVVKGNERLNFCFVANIFNNYPALDAVEEKVIEEIKEIELDEELSREEQCFKYWIESLGFEIDDLYRDLSNGLILLKLIDVIRPGTVDWRVVCKKPSRKRIMQCVGNCAHAINLSRDKLGCKIVNIGGSDIAKMNKKLTLGLVWQLMRAHVLAILEEVGGGKRIEEKELIAWANKKNQKPHSLRSFRDKRLCSGEYLIHLCKAVSPQSVDTQHILQSGNDDDNFLKKIGATIFITPADIVEVKQKMLLTFFAALMKRDLEINK